MNRVLIVIGGEYHEFDEGGCLLAETLSATGRFETTVTDATDTLTSATLEQFDLVVPYLNKGISESQAKALDEFVGHGHGLLAVHCANSPREKPDAYLDLIGSAFVNHGPVHDFAVTIDAPNHDVTCRIPNFRITDELYETEPRGEACQVLATAHWQGRRVPMVCVKSHGEGRVAYLAMGHDRRALENPDFRSLLVHAADWASGRDETREVGVGLVGYGPAFRMGKHHGDRIGSTRGLRLAAACDKDPKCLETAREDFPEIATYGAVKEMLTDDAVELAVLILPHHLHGPIALQCLEAGRHVVLEKPFCLTVDEATRMIDAARAKDLTLTVYHNRRFDGDFLTVRRAVEAGLIGEVFQAQISWCAFGEPGTWWRSSKEISGGLMYDWGAHLLDWLLNVLPGKVESVTGFLHKRRWWGTTNEDHGLAVMRFEGGRTGMLEMSSLGRHSPFRWRILGTKGSIVSHGSDDIHLATEIDGQSGSMKLDVHPAEHVRWYNNLAEHLLRDVPLVVRPEEARRVIAVLETVEKSSQSGAAESVPYEDDFALPTS